MPGERSYTIEMQCSVIERPDGSWAVELLVTNIPTEREARAISRWARGLIDTSVVGTDISMEPQQ